jgi:hypothetical protein
MTNQHKVVLDTVQRYAELLNSFFEKPVVRTARLNTIGLWIIPTRSGTPVYVPGTDGTRRTRNPQDVVASLNAHPMSSPSRCFDSASANENHGSAANGEWEIVR